VREVAAELCSWSAQGQALALATVVSTWGSAPRRVGAKLLLSADGRVAGSVSGGCVEAAVIEAGREVLRAGAPRRLRFGVADETAWSVGLACGGAIEVWVEALDPAWVEALLDALDDEGGAATLTLLDGPDAGAGLLVRADGSLRARRPDAQLTAPETWRTSAESVLAAGESALVTCAGAAAFVDVLLPPPTLVVVGGVHIAVALVELAHTLGWRAVVVDPRPAFAAPERFPRAHAIVSAWPDEALARVGLTANTAVAVLTHDPKLDDPALLAALPSPAFYVGALGSRATQSKRRARLLAAGLGEDHLARLHAPIGLDLGGRGPEEIALAVMAQVVQQRHRRPSASAEPPSGGPP
jgi:xanthine dehydrogenase accessory factor